MSVIEKIEAQQKALKEGCPAWAVGEQLKDMCREDGRLAELVEKDLDIQEMDISHAEKKIKAYADSHKSGNFAFVPPKEAERILREFYGGAERETTERPARGSRIRDITDFL